MVKRVFCYSKDIAKKNGNNLPILSIALTIVFLIVSILLLLFLNIFSIKLYLSITLIFIIIIIYLGLIMRKRIDSMLSGFCITDDGKIFKVTALRGQEIFLSGLAIGNYIEQLLNIGENLGSNLGGGLGAVMQFYSTNKLAKYMNNPTILSKFIENMPNVKGVSIIEITKVYKITNNNKKVIINCDYEDSLKKLNKVKKDIAIEKSYNCFDDLINALNLKS